MSEVHCDAPMTYVEIQGLYDGALFLQCEVCGAWRHRFPAGHYLRERAERVAHLYDATKEISHVA